MKGFSRKDQAFSMCGLSCALCPMKLGGYCPGCGGGEGNQSCTLARCSLERGGLEYCFQCGQYPCEKYENFDQYDSFLTHQGRARHVERARQLGVAQYRQELKEKASLLQTLLTEFYTGRKKTFYCVAVDLLELEDIRAVADQFLSVRDQKERERKAVAFLEELAVQRGTTLKLRKKPKKAKQN
ncbi:MAG: DUF3795 domain-containing protein [Lawsonibacter sp.]|nr:DUF3795 domain-containing protein [Lawsonibacter sp.]